MRVPFFDNRASFIAEWPELSDAIDRVVTFDKFSHGAVTREAEVAVAGFTGAGRAVGAGSGSDALELIIRATGAGPGDEVIVPAFAAVRTASAVRHAGARPVFADVTPGSLTLAPRAVRPAITGRTRAIVVAHLFSQVAEVAELRVIADRAGVALVEDCADATGARSGGVHAGLHGAAGALSFSATRVLGALGDAGMVITDDAALADRCLLLRHHGRAGEVGDRGTGPPTAALLSGLNSKMDEIQAAVLASRLSRLPAVISRRHELAARYCQRLAEIPQVRIPQVRATEQVWSDYVIEVPERNALARFLADAGIETRTDLARPLHLLPPFADPGHRGGIFPVAEAAAAETLALPLYPDLEMPGVDHVCRMIEQFFAPAGG